MPETTKPFWRSRWWMPAFCPFLGLLTLGASWALPRESGH